MRASSGIRLAAAALTLTVGVATGVWAEFADLNQAGLLAVGIPTLLVATAAVALSLDEPPARRAGGAVIAGALLGWLLLSVSEGLYLGLHYARGGTLDIQGLDTQREMAGRLFLIHTCVGAVLGLMIGLAVATGVLVYALVRARRPVHRPERPRAWTV